jgi:hypothetical protein
MRKSCPPCTHDCNQGRTCPNDQAAPLTVPDMLIVTFAVLCIVALVLEVLK